MTLLVTYFNNYHKRHTIKSSIFIISTNVVSGRHFKCIYSIKYSLVAEEHFDLRVMTVSFYPSGALALECAQVLINVSIVWKRSASVTWLTLRSSTSSSFTNCIAKATAM